MNRTVHYYDREAMVYTACYRLTHSIAVTSDKVKVTCPKCLGKIAAQAIRVAWGGEKQHEPATRVCVSGPVCPR